MQVCTDNPWILEGSDSGILELIFTRPDLEKFKFHTFAIITHGLYFFDPLLEDHFFVFKEVFLEIFVLMYGEYSRADYDGARMVDQYM
jgi:hypothetical protein